MMALDPMQESRGQDLEEIFHQALARKAPGERDAFLDGACAGNADLRTRAEALLAAHDEAQGFLEAPALGGEPTMNGGDEPGKYIGPYKILQQIGEGGMGVDLDGGAARRRSSAARSP